MAPKTDWIEVSTVSLRGNITLVGMSTRNLERLRDACELHLHPFSGMVRFVRGDDTVYIAANVVEHAACPVSRATDSFVAQNTDVHTEPPPPVFNESQYGSEIRMKQALEAAALEVAARTLADDVLDELLEPKSAESDASAVKRRRRSSKKAD